VSEDAAVELPQEVTALQREPFPHEAPEPSRGRAGGSGSTGDGRPKSSYEAAGEPAGNQETRTANR